ncbi:sensor domain-containing diguanylate cyclase [Lysobacter xanthus]
MTIATAVAVEDANTQRAAHDGRAAATLRSRFNRLLAVAVFLPALLFGLLQLWSDFRTAESNLREQLRVATRLTATSIDQFMQEHASAAALVADEASVNHELPHLPALIERYPTFITVLATNATGRIVAAEPARVAALAVGQSVADRDYFRGAINSLEPYVSNAFVGRGLGSDPIVAVSAPIMRDGSVSGIVEGSIRIDSFARLRSSVLRTRRQEMLIVDRTGHVVNASEGLPQAFLQKVTDACFLQGRESADGVTVARLCPGVLRDGGDAWTAWTQLHSGWRVVLFTPRAPVLATLLRQAASMLGVLVLAVAGALIVAGWQMRRLERVARAVFDRLHTIANGGRAADMPIESIPGELRPIAIEVSKLAARLDCVHGDLLDAVERERQLADSLRAAVERQEQEIHARTLELRAANLELERVSRTDALTATLNVRGFRGACDELIGREGELHAPLGVISFDVDHFKAFNDRYGHPLGDRVLRRVAGAAQACLRDTSDRIARVGGEEFVVLLPDADLETTLAVAERIRVAALALGIPHEDTPDGRVSVSIGVIAAAKGELLEGILGQVDGALYRAKSGGRNRVSD